jgi:hypothetical protein
VTYSYAIASRLLVAQFIAQWFSSVAGRDLQLQFAEAMDCLVVNVMQYVLLTLWCAAFAGSAFALCAAIPLVASRP